MSLGLLLSIARSIHIAHNDFINKKEKYGGEISQKNFLIKNKTFGFIGFGDLAKATLPLIKPFANKILAYDPWIPKTQMKSKNIYSLSLNSVMKNSDIILFLHFYYYKQAMINHNNLNLMKDTPTILIIRQQLLISEIYINFKNLKLYLQELMFIPKHLFPKNHPSLRKLKM